MVRKSVLANGIRVLSETIPQHHAVSLGVWVLTGSRDERDAENGVSHFVEHLLFKGTETRTAEDIARAIDSVGGSMNGFTGREITCFHAKVLDSDLRLAIDLMADMLLHSLFDSEEIERERSVIIQEVKMVEDTPDDYVHDLFTHAFWGDHPMAQPIFGRVEKIQTLSRDQMVRYFTRQYRSDRMIIAVAGNVDHDKVVDMVGRAFLPVLGDSETDERRTPAACPKMSLLERDIEQVHLCLGTEGLTYSSSRRFVGYILNAVLGGGVSSRLFQEIRERRGLAYSIFSYMPSYMDTGMFVVYGATEKEAVGQVVDLIWRELETLRRNPIRQEELTLSKQQLRGNLLLSLENSENRMTRLAKNEIYFQRFLSVDEVLDEIDKVTVDQVSVLCDELLRPDGFCLTFLGPVTEDRLNQDLADIRIPNLLS
jgi:predicted Zn-dependent peptidase